MADLDEITGSLVIRPGDTLILRTSAATRQQLDEISELIRARLPEDVKLLVLGGVDQMAVFRP